MSRPVLHGLVRIRVAAGLRRKGYGFMEARELASSLTAEIIDAASPESVQAIGDGTLFQLIIDFLNSEAGKALIDALIKLLIGFL